MHGLWPAFSKLVFCQILWISFGDTYYNLPVDIITCFFLCVSLILLKIVKFFTHLSCTNHKGHSTSLVVHYPTPLISPMFPWPIFQCIFFKLLTLNFSPVFLFLGSLPCPCSSPFMVSFSSWIHDSIWWGALPAKEHLHSPWP